MRGSGYEPQGLTMRQRMAMTKSRDVSTRQQVGDVESQFAEHERQYQWHGLRQRDDDW